MEQWNALAAQNDYCRCPSMTKSRRESHNARYRDTFWRENWQVALQRISVKGSDFLRGVNDRGWKANIEWFLREDTVVKILEGRHDAKAAKPKRTPSPQETKKEIEDECFRRWGRVINDPKNHAPLPADHPAYLEVQQ